MIFLKVNGKRIERFNDINVVLKFDSVASTFTFVYWFDPNDTEVADISALGGYARAEIFDGDNLLITGTILSHSHADASEKTLSQVSGYSLPGVLEDCEIPVSAYPLQAQGKSLADLSRQLIKPFGLDLVVNPDVQGAVSTAIVSTAAEPTSTVKAYLATLASHRNVILSHDNRGRLLLTRAGAKQPPYANIEPGTYTSMSLSFNGQSMHSEITAIKQASAGGGNAGQFTVTNPYVTGFRPRVVIQDSGDDNTTRSVAEKALANEVSQITLNITFSSWYLAGELLTPNKVVSVQNTEIGIKNKTNWFIESVTLMGNETSQTAQIQCVLPQVYNGQVARVNLLK